MHPELKPHLLLAAYAHGIFPMGDEDGTISWYSPDPRAIIELSDFHVPRTVRQVCQRNVFEVHVNHDFLGVMRACADRPEGTWISADILAAYDRLHRLGYAHSIETWQSGRLVGGLYGVAIGGAFFGESMFHRESNASKVALAHLVRRLVQRGYTLLDVQFMTPHLARFGATTLPRREYLQRLDEAVRKPCTFLNLGSART